VESQNAPNLLLMPVRRATVPSSASIGAERIRNTPPQNKLPVATSTPTTAASTTPQNVSMFAVMCRRINICPIGRRILAALGRKLSENEAGLGGCSDMSVILGEG
jgi:hypothetical protein